MATDGWNSTKETLKWFLQSSEYDSFYRFSRIGTGMCDRTGSKSCLIGKNTSGNTLFSDSAIASYFQKKGYETEDGKLDAGKTTYFLRLIVGIVLGVGLFISILSFYILMLSIFLLLQKNTTKLESLLLIGYSPNKVALPYQLLTVGLNVIVLVLSIGLVSWLRSYYIDSIRILFPQLETGSLWAAISMGILLFIVVSVINILAVKKKVLSIWMHKS